MDPGRQTADTPEQGRAMVRDRKRAGADLIKVYSGLRPAVYRAVVDEAKALGLPNAAGLTALTQVLTRDAYDHLGKLGSMLAEGSTPLSAAG